MLARRRRVRRAADDDDGAAPVLDADLGGDTTRHGDTRTSFAFPAPNLTAAQRRQFELGDSFFTKNWVTAPASTDARDGLGPVFNAQACSSCHVLDGRGVPAVPDGSTVPIGLLLRISVPGETSTGAPMPHPEYGGQIQDRSILGVPAEGAVDVSWELIDGAYADGSPYTLVRPTYTVAEPQFGPLGEDTMISPRLAPQVIGMGLLEAIPEDAILRAADPQDEDGDGVSGRPNMVWGDEAQATVLGRFGWKANVATVEQQVAGAFIGDIGITSSAHPDQDCGPAQTECAEAIDGGEPEITDERLADVTFYGRTLSVPAMRDVEDEEVREGIRGFEIARVRVVPHALADDGRYGRRRAVEPDVLSLHRPAAPRHGRGPGRRPARFRGVGFGVADAAAVGARARRRDQRCSLPAS